MEDGGKAKTNVIAYIKHKKIYIFERSFRSLDSKTIGLFFSFT